MTTILHGALCAILLVPVLLGQVLAAEEPPILYWKQLIPPEVRTPDASSGKTPSDVVEQGSTNIPLDENGKKKTAFVTTYNGERVRIPGYMVPLDIEQTEVKEFLLVPYVGACIHVPPPPPNQIVYIQSEKAVAMRDVFEPIWVTGMFATTTLSTTLADVGYQITADDVAPFVEQ